MIKNPTFSVLEITISILTIPSTIQQLADFCINDGRKMLCSHIFLIKKCMILQSSNHVPTDQKTFPHKKKADDPIMILFKSFDHQKLVG